MKWKTEPIALIGSGCRFPGHSDSPSKLWSLLENPRDILVSIPSDRFNVSGVYHRNGEHHGSTNATHAYLCEQDYRVFDHRFFNIHPKEAETMDPQQKILLEVVYEALESAGYSISQLRGSSTAVFVGQMADDYYDLLLRDVDNIPQYAGTGSARSIVANRISYFFDWKGASMNIDTACSSSLVALHQAVQSLRSGESDLAVVAGVNLILGPEHYITESKLHMLSPTGRSRMWDASADGYARGEGFAVLILKRLDQAVADKDHIECIIRETSVNQDGRTSGLTVPSATSQAALIKSTYKKCGLDCAKPEDRCQYFEAHGTGTLAGDPKEAEAIYSAFFSQSNSLQRPNNVIYVGSIKTVIGHSEGAAGLAGVLKASLAVQHGKIPPNMLFNTLNPAIKPFSTNLHVPTELLPWPNLGVGVPRRASVNSFGFGGTNAHAIIESFEAGYPGDTHINLETPGWPVGLVTLSANSDLSLQRTVASLHERLREPGAIDLADLSWTLQCRRSTFAFRETFCATSRAELARKLAGFHEKRERHHSVTHRGLISVSEAHPVRILGVFTGQGAQWHGMGRRLYAFSGLFRKTMLSLEESLSDLAQEAGWSLTNELMNGSAQSLTEFSQPLTTAIQIGLVELLKVAGLHFSAVVGHSSGEIAATYAAGHLSASDAIRVAYCRGLACHRAQSSDGKQGRMMAVKMPYKEAEAFCEREPFFGKVYVAAVNSQSSTTLSGDEDAMKTAELLLQSDGVSTKLLQVDKAYHSPHMEPCIDTYLQLLRLKPIPIQSDESGRKCYWYSSVYGSDGRSIQNPQELRDTYWAQNMMLPVLFSQALERAITEQDCFDIVIEVGPHPSLRSPVIQTFKTLAGVDIAYCGTLERNIDDLAAVFQTIGFIWKHIESPTSVINFESFLASCMGEHFRPPRLIKTLPAYSWDHQTLLFQESATSMSWRARSDPVHELLGRPTSLGNRREIRWRNVFKLDEMGWLRGHQFQHQVLFPASGYISMVYEAAMYLVRGREVQLIEANDLKFHRALTVPEGASGTEVIFIVRVISDDGRDISAEYSCYSRDAYAGTSLQPVDQTNFTGKVLISLGQPDPSILPSRACPKLPLSNVDTKRFYSWTSSIGLQYSGGFLVSSISRRLGFSTVVVERTKNSSLRVNPANLDAALHGMFAAFCFPDDYRMSTPYLPTSIRRVRINMLCPSASQHKDWKWLSDSYIRDVSSKTISGDVDLFCGEDAHPEIQIQGLVCSSFSAPSVQDDRNIFSRNIWKRDISSPFDISELIPECRSSCTNLHSICNRMSYFFLRKLVHEISRDEVTSMELHLQCFMDWAYRSVASQRTYDELETITAWKDENRDQIDVEIIYAVGQCLPAIVRGKIPALQILMENNRLYRLYKDGLGFHEANHRLGATISRLAHRYPQMKILEVGAGTGGSTETVFRYIGSKFSKYTFTDVSAGFFESARSTFEKDYKGKIEFRVLNIERPPTEQDFEEHSFDLVIASNVLHATKSLSATVTNCRSLLRPGGFLVIMEITNETIRVPFMVGALPGWWLGREDGRTQSPTVTEIQWDSVLRRCQFSGTDTILRDTDDQSKQTVSVMTSQAINQEVSRLRDPLGCANEELAIRELTIVGGFSPFVAQVAHSIRQHLLPFTSNILILNNLEAVAERGVPPGSTVLCMCDLEEPCFQQMGSKKLRAVQTIFKDSRHLVWISSGCRASDPYANMIVGLGRSAAMEYPHIRLQILDFESYHLLNPKLLAETLLRLVYLDLLESEDIMWSVESELVLAEDGIYIPRVIPDDTLNRRFNSSRRKIEYPTSIEAGPIEIACQGGSLLLKETSPILRRRSDGYTTVKVHFSTMAPALSSDKHRFYICTGFTVPYAQKVMVLSSTNASLITVLQEDTINLDWRGDDAINLREFLSVILCESVSHGVTETLWVHDADEYIREALGDICRRVGFNLFLSTSSQSPDGGSVFVHERAPMRDVESLIPPNVERFVDMSFSNSAGLSSLAEAAVRAGANPHRPFRTSTDGHFLSLLLTRREFRTIMQRVVRSRTLAAKAQCFARPIPIDTVSQPLVPQCPLAVVDWTSADIVSVQATPLNAHELFCDRKTYLLVGLTGDIGISLCEWMVSHGAKHLAVASRNPRVNDQVIKHLQSKGAVLKIFAFDIADRAALDRVYEEITSTMPPIAGVANAAMVLQDKPLDNMSLQDFEDVLRPKVLGSKNLDDLFRTTELDFFILFSSMSSVVGNPAQSNYGAANMFMSSLAARRRKRGLAASVIDIAMILGVGYVTRSLDSTSSAIESQMSRFAYLALSETDFHTIFAEGIFTGRPDLGGDPELLTGLDTHSKAPWRRISRFAHYFTTSALYKEPSGENRSLPPESRINSIHKVRSRLSQVQDNEDAIKILKAALAIKLGFILQEPHDNIDQTTPLVAMGIDSLIAVEIRSWLLKELGIDVPVLQILSGWSVEDICRDSMAKFGHLPQNEKERVEASNDSEFHTLSVHKNPSQAQQVQLQPRIAVNLIGERKFQTGSATTELRYQRTGEMSEAQARLFFLHDYLLNKASYNVGYIGKITGQMCLDKLRQALQVVGLKHEGLRTSFYIEQSTGKAIQAVKWEPRITLEHKRILNEHDIQREIELLRHHIFNIDDADTMKVVILSQTTSLHNVIILHHHIALDGLGWLSFMQDLHRAYSGEPLQEYVQQPIDMTSKNIALSIPSLLENRLAFWARMYRTPVNHLPLFGFSKSPARRLLTTYDTETFDVELAPELAQSVRRTAATLGVTAFHFYLTSLLVMLGCCLDTHDFSIGIVDANRPDQEDRNTIGHFLNMLPLRFRLDPQESFQNLAQKSEI